MTSLLDIKVLLVDDSNTVLTILKKSLNQIGIKNFSVAEDGSEAWSKLVADADTEPFNLVLCDWIMPEISGIDLLKMVRESANPKIAKIRFIMVTGSSDKVKLAMDAGADNIISKPFTPEFLREKLEFVLR